MEMKATVKIVKIDNSLGFILPERIVKAERIEGNDLIKIKVKNLRKT